MKRNFRIIMIAAAVFTWMILLTGCKSKAVKSTESSIDFAWSRLESARDNEDIAQAISFIYSAKTEYDSLSANDQKKVQNSSLLNDAVYAADSIVALEDGYSVLETTPTQYKLEENTLVPYIYIENTGVCTYENIKVKFTFYNKNRKELKSQVASIDEEAKELKPGDMVDWFAISNRLDYPIFETKYFSVEIYSFTKKEP